MMKQQQRAVAVFTILFIGSSLLIYENTRPDRKLLSEENLTVIKENSAVEEDVTPSVKEDSLTVQEMFRYFQSSDKEACQLYFEFGGHLLNVENNVGIDGQKPVCLRPYGIAPKPGNCTVYSFGIGYDWSFDEDLEEFGCRVFAFDPSMQLWNHKHSKRVLFFRVGLFNQDVRQTNGWRMYRLVTLREKLGHTDKTIDYLKIDIEGGEWAVLDQLIDTDQLQTVKQLSLEIHLNAERVKEQYRVLRKLEDSGFVRFFCRENPWSVTKFEAINQNKPSCYEMAWYNKRYLN